MKQTRQLAMRCNGKAVFLLCLNERGQIVDFATSCVQLWRTGYEDGSALKIKPAEQASAAYAPKRVRPRGDDPD